MPNPKIKPITFRPNNVVALKIQSLQKVSIEKHREKNVDKVLNEAINLGWDQAVKNLKFLKELEYISESQRDSIIKFPS